jgi:hypothetical protein
LNRSIYVPVSLRVCEHLDESVLYVDEQPAGYLPTKRTFLFTYYSSLKRIEPQATQLRVEGRRTDGSEFVARLAVTAHGIYTANENIDFDREVLRQFRYKVDVRHQTTALQLQCDTICARSPNTPVVAETSDVQARPSAAETETLRDQGQRNR